MTLSNASPDANSILSIQENQKELISQFFFWRCNAVSFESNLCEEANVVQLEDINVGETEKDFLIRSEEVR